MAATPMLFSDLALSRRLERAEAHSNAKLVEARSGVSPESHAQWIEVAGAYAIFDGIDSPLTQTFGLGLFEPVSPVVLERLEGFYGDLGAPVFHEVSPLAEGALPLLGERGYRPVEASSVMFRAIGRHVESVQSQSSRPRVRPIETQEGELWAKVHFEGWGEAPELSEFLLALGPLSTRREDAVSFLAELDGEPIAAGAMSLHGGVGLLAGASTVPEARRRGAQLALLDFRLCYAAERGCDVAMMVAEPGSASQRNAERHGFRVAYTRIKWQRIGSAPIGSAPIGSAA